MEDIYAFHSKIFLKDLEECKNTPGLVGKCFTNRVHVFFLFYSPFFKFTAQMAEWLDVYFWSGRLRFDSESGQTNDLKIGIHRFSA